MIVNAATAAIVRTKGRMLLISVSLGLCAYAAEPPENWVRKVAARETETQAARAHYTYRQTTTFEDFEKSGIRSGLYKEIREVIFSPGGERTERQAAKPTLRPGRLKLTDEDFRDLKEIQPMLLTTESLFLYETRYRGEDTVEGRDCWLLEIRPRQILAGQRLFEGQLWIDQKTFSILRSEGQAVPQIHTVKEENLFPRFSTIRSQIDGDHWFPVETKGDDVLPFRTGPVRIRLRVEYADYRRFGAKSKITFTEPK